MEDIIYFLVVNLFGFFLSLGGIVLNYAINTFVIGFGTQFSDNGIGFIVDQSWATLRDLFNIVFIFGLVAIGFKMILRVNDSNSKRWLVMLILAALLVNFSLFISKFIVDFSNIVAVEMINEGMQTQTADGRRVFRPDPDGVNVSGSMSDMLKLPTTFSAQSAETNPGKKTWGLIFGTMIIYIVGTFVFLSAGILLIIRAAVLIVLMIASPFLFIGMVFPSLQGSASKLWKMLLTRSFFAPIYITFLYITLKVAGDYMSSVSGSTNYGAAFNSDGTAGADSATIGATFGPFIIITALLMISLVAAQRIGVEGGATAVKMGKSAMGYGRKQLGRGAARGTGALARNTIGRAAHNAANSERGLQRASGGFVDRQIAGFYRKAAATSFDARGEKGSKYGTKRKGGYAANQEATKKKEKEYAKTLERDAYDSNGNPKADFEEMRNNDSAYSLAKSQSSSLEIQKRDLEDAIKIEKERLLAEKQNDNQLNILKSKLANSTDPTDRKNLEDKISVREDEIETDFFTNNPEFKEFSDQLSELTKNIGAAKRNLDNENARLEGDYKYKYVDKLKETRNREKEFWKPINESGDDTVSAGVVGAGIGMMFAGPVGAAVGAAAGAAIKKAATNAFVDGADARLGEITKEYGKDGRKKVKDKGKNDILKNLQNELKKNGGDTPTGETT